MDIPYWSCVSTVSTTGTLLVVWSRCLLDSPWGPTEVLTPSVSSRDRSTRLRPSLPLDAHTGATGRRMSNRTWTWNHIHGRPRRRVPRGVRSVVPSDSSWTAHPVPHETENNEPPVRRKSPFVIPVEGCPDSQFCERLMNIDATRHNDRLEKTCMFTGYFRG